MKILQLTYALSSGGAERFIVDLCNDLAKNPELEIVLVCTDDDKLPLNAHYLPDVDQSRIKYICCGAKSGFSLKSFINTYKTIKREKPDIVHAHCSVLNIAPSALFNRKPKYAHTLHNVAPICLEHRWLKGFYKYLYKHRIKPITISKICRESYEKLYENNLAVQIDNGRSPIHLTDKADEVKAQIQKLFPQGPIFINVARCHPQKNHALLFETFASLPNYNLMVIGSGFEDSEFMRYNDHPNIKILDEKRNVADYLNAAQYFVLSSHYEGLPISLLEAMSLGLIPVTTPVGGIVDVIEDGVTGYMSASVDADSFRDAVIRAAENISNVSPERIIKEYSSKYSMTTCAKNYLDVFKSLL